MRINLRQVGGATFKPDFQSGTNGRETAAANFIAYICQGDVLTSGQHPISRRANLHR